MTTSRDEADQARELSVEILAEGSTTSILLHGDADGASLDYLEASLSSLELVGSASVHLQVADLEFCDVSAMRQITLFARQVREAGRPVTLSGATPMVHEMARLMNVEGDLGLV